MNRQAGITLIELVISISVLAIALTGITVMISGGLARSADTLLEVRSIALAQAYLDEILGKRFDENSHDSGIPPCRNELGVMRQCSSAMGAESGETRGTFDDVDDYDGLDEGWGAVDSTLRDALGNPRVGFDNFRVSVSVREVQVASGGAESTLAVANELDDSQDAKLVSVNIAHPGLSEGIVFSAYKSNF